MFGQKLFVDTRLVVEAFEKPFRHELHEIPIPRRRLREKNQMVVRVGDASVVRRFLEARSGCDVDFAAENRLDSPLLCRVVEIDGTEHVAVIGERQSRHLVACREIDHLVDAARSVEK